MKKTKTQKKYRKYIFIIIAIILYTIVVVEIGKNSYIGLIQKNQESYKTMTEGTETSKLQQQVEKLQDENEEFAAQVSNAIAYEENILSGQLAWVNGNIEEGTMPVLTEHNFSGSHSSTSAGAASNYTVKSTSRGYVADNITVATLPAETSPTIATTGATGTKTIDIKPGYYNKIKVNQTNAYTAGYNEGYNAGYTAGYNARSSTSGSIVIAAHFHGLDYPNGATLYFCNNKVYSNEALTNVVKTYSSSYDSNTSYNTFKSGRNNSIVYSASKPGSCYVGNGHTHNATGTCQRCSGTLTGWYDSGHSSCYWEVTCTVCDYKSSGKCGSADARSSVESVRGDPCPVYYCGSPTNTWKASCGKEDGQIIYMKVLF